MNEPTPDLFDLPITMGIAQEDAAKGEVLRVAPYNPTPVAQGEANKAAAIARVVEGTNDRWRAAALGVIRWLAANRDTFTTDDVWPRLEGYFTPEPRAMGGVIKSAQGAKLIRPTAEWKMSVRPECNRRPVRVWERVR